MEFTDKPFFLIGFFSHLVQFDFINLDFHFIFISFWKYPNSLISSPYNSIRWQFEGPYQFSTNRNVSSNLFKLIEIHCQLRKNKKKNRKFGYLLSLFTEKYINTPIRNQEP